jgi:alkanesulfonate monooxygenase SsuD/methylene tetrahydromethanopterin reductase-like flavin-dependent oxidoreductase (luciferase family)
VRGELGFGIAAAPRGGTERLGPSVEALGYAELWANDTHRGSGPATLAAAGAATRRLRFGIGVMALSQRGPRPIAEEVAAAGAAGLALERTTVGVGSGASRSLALVRRGVEELRTLLPGQRIAVAAVGPRMCALAGEIADTVLLNWALPAHLAAQRRWVNEAADRAGRPMPRVTAYVRVAVGAGATERLRAEMARYAGRSAAYRTLFADQDGPIGVAATDAASLRAGLLPYRALLDCCVVRALPDGDAVDDWLRVAEAAAP